MNDPQMTEEWQEAVDAARVLLSIDAARQYGLVEGGPEVDVDRCSEILDCGKAQGHAPSPRAIEEVLSGREA